LVIHRNPKPYFQNLTLVAVELLMKKKRCEGNRIRANHLVTAQGQYFENGAEAPCWFNDPVPAVETAGNGYLLCREFYFHNTGNGLIKK
jgi:hypothetical protein